MSDTGANRILEGLRILVVEDEAMIAMLMEDMLADLGCVVIGPAYSLESAMEMAAAPMAIDAAVLDVNLGGKSSFDVADALKARGVPAIFSTGYGESGLRAVDDGAQVLQKPFRAGDLERALRTVMDGATAG
ncbi:MAG: response regulator [Caulobacteraceae bacterium]